MWNSKFENMQLRPCFKATGYPFVALNENQVPAGLQLPVLVKVSSSESTEKNQLIVSWLHSEATLPCERLDCQMKNQGDIGASVRFACANSRVTDILFRKEITDSGISIDIDGAEISNLFFKTARQEDLPNALSVYVSRNTYQKYKSSEFRQTWALVTHNGRCTPLRLLPKDYGLDDRHFAAGALIRRFLDPIDADLTDKPIQFSKPFIVSNKPTDPSLDHHRSWHARKMSVVVHGLKNLGKSWLLISDFLERIIKLYFHAPKMALFSEGSFLGDDPGRIVRLHKPTFDMLGINPGDRVEVSWCGVKTFAIALEQKDFNDALAIESSVKTNKNNGMKALHHLYIGVSSGVRFDLGMPMKSAVEVRRKILPLVVQQINSSLLPVISVIAGGITIKLNNFATALLAVVTLLLSLGKLRLTKAPSGRFLSW